MVRYILKRGFKIKLLPPPSAEDGEEENCQQCGKAFDANTYRRCSYARCDHVFCFECVMNSKIGCSLCVSRNEEATGNSSDTLPKSTCGMSKEGVNGDSIEESRNENSGLLENAGEEDGDDEEENDGREVRRGLRKRSESKSYVQDSGSGRWTCDYCPTAFSDKNSLGQHYRKEHSNERSYNCSVCDWCVMTKKQLTSHEKTHDGQRPFRCPFCSASFSRKYIAVRHMTTHHSDKIQVLPLGTAENGHCGLCKTEYGSNEFSSFRKAKYVECGHISCLACIVTSEKGCIQCLPTYKKEKKVDLNGTKENKKRKRMDEKVPPTASDNPPKKKGKMYKSCPDLPTEESFDLEKSECKCPICDRMFSRMYSLERHVEKSHREIIDVSVVSPEKNGPPRCPLCYQKFESVLHSKFRKSMYVNCGHYVCLQCVIRENVKCSQCPQSNGHTLPKENGKRFMDEQGKSETEDEGEKPAENGVHVDDGRFHCQLCKFSFSRRLSLERHLGRKHHVRLINMEDDTKEQKSEDAYCPECQEEFGASQDNQKAAFIKCGHVSCLQCIYKAELGCGQCTTENASRWQERSPMIPSPTKSEIAFRTSSARKGYCRSLSMPPDDITHIDNSEQSSEFLNRTMPSRTEMVLNEGQEITLPAKRRVGRPRKVPLPEVQSQGSSQESASERDVTPAATPITPAVRSSKRISRRPRYFLSPTPSIELSDENKQRSRVSSQERDQPATPNNTDGVVKRGRGRPPKNLARNSAPTPLENVSTSTVNKKVLKKTIRCIHCNESFPDNVAKGIHLQHYHARERPFSCHLCQWRFRSQKDLDRHQLKHTKEKPFRCDLCAAAFTRVYTLRDHLADKHGIQRENVSN